MSQKDLIPFNKLSKERHRELSSKGGKTVTPKQIMSQKLRWLKKKGYTTKEDRNWFLERIIDPNIDIIYMQEWLDKLKNALPEDKQAGLMGNAIALHKAKFGEKHKNLNINVTLTEDELRQRGEDLDREIIEIMKS